MMSSPDWKTTIKSSFVRFIGSAAITAIFGAGFRALMIWLLPDNTSEAIPSEAIQGQLAAQELRIRREIYGSLTTLFMSMFPDSPELKQAERQVKEGNRLFDTGDRPEAFRRWEEARPVLLDGCSAFRRVIKPPFGQTGIEILIRCGSLSIPILDPKDMERVYTPEGEGPPSQ